MKMTLERVHTMPPQLQPGVLYVAQEFGTAAHLCACGCGSKVRTPLAETEWRLTDHPEGPSLHPSIGNWQRPCQAHYWIARGEIRWSTQWTVAQIAAGRAAEERRRESYYADLYRTSLWTRAWRWIRSMFKPLA